MSHMIEKVMLQSEVSTMENEETSEGVIEREEEVWQSIYMLLDHREIEGITAIDMIKGTMEVDPYNRYLATFQVLGVNDEEEIDLYDYYIVVQEDEENKLFILPFGIEILPSNHQSIKKDIAKSILKVANGWGLPSATMNQEGINSSEKIPTVGNDAILKSIATIQSIITFMENYMTNWLNAIEAKEPSLVEHYYEEGSKFKKVQIDKIKKLNKNEMTVEIYDVQVVDIKCVKEDTLFEVTIRGDFRVYSKEQIKMMDQVVTYTLEKNNDTFLLIEEKIIKKE